MSNLKTLSAVFFFFSALGNLQAGCPDLAGTYTCTSSKGQVEVGITQKTDVYLTTTYSFSYHNHNREIIADNQERTDSKGHTYKAYCGQNDDVLHYMGSSSKWEVHARFSLTSESSLMIAKEYENLDTGETRDKSHVCPMKES